MKPTNEMIAAAWQAWHKRHGGKLGPGPAFVEAIEAAIIAAPTDMLVRYTIQRLEKELARTRSLDYSPTIGRHQNEPSNS